MTWHQDGWWAKLRAELILWLLETRLSWTSQSFESRLYTGKQNLRYSVKYRAASGPLWIVNVLYGMKKEFSSCEATLKWCTMEYLPLLSCRRQQDTWSGEIGAFVHWDSWVDIGYIALGHSKGVCLFRRSLQELLRDVTHLGLFESFFIFRIFGRLDLPSKTIEASNTWQGAAWGGNGHPPKGCQPAILPARMNRNPLPCLWSLPPSAQWPLSVPLAPSLSPPAPSTASERHKEMKLRHKLESCFSQPWSASPALLLLRWSQAEGTDSAKEGRTGSPGQPLLSRTFWAP